MAVLWWTLAVGLVIVGIAGTLLPALPGPILVFAGILAAAWIDDFARIGVGTLIVLGLLTLAAHLADVISSVLGVRRARASGRAVAGASLGALAGLFFGIPGMIVGPFAGAVVAELTVRRDLTAAGRAGLAAWIGFLIGTAVRLGLVVAMVAIAVAAFFFF
jgi:uncharacterized protein YqgC (DUF456 family)